MAIATTPATVASNKPAMQQESITNKVLRQVKELEGKGQMVIPKNYSPENALKSAWLILQDVKTRDGQPVLKACTEHSIGNALYDMVIQGLSPVKKQCYFIPYNNKLTLMRSYHGTIAAIKRLSGVKDIRAHVVYEGDVFETEYDPITATIKVKEYKPSFDNIDIKKIKGAFAVVLDDRGPIYTEVMTMAQIRNAWNQGQTKGKSGAHENFSEEMAKRTVINRASKAFYNTSDDSDILIEALQNSEEKSYEESDIVEASSFDVMEEDTVTEKEVIDVTPKTETTSTKRKRVEQVEVEQMDITAPIDAQDAIFEGAPF